MDGYNTFNTAPYAAYTTDHLKAAVADGRGNEKMVGEIARRALRDAGDVSVMTPSERLKFFSSSRLTAEQAAALNVAGFLTPAGQAAYGRKAKTVEAGQ